MEPTVFRFCDACNDDRHYNRVVRRETVVIRGVAVSADIRILVCPVCGETQPDMADGYDDMAVLFDAYRKLTGKPFP
jgi:hypothetical protein